MSRAFQSNAIASIPLHRESSGGASRIKARSSQLGDQQTERIDPADRDATLCNSVTALLIPIEIRG